MGAEWAGYAGLGVGVAGWSTTLYQVIQARRSIGSAARAVRHIATSQLLLLLPEIGNTVSELDLAVSANDHDLGRRVLTRFHHASNRALGILGEHVETDEEFLSLVREGSIRSQIAVESLHDVKRTVQASTVEIRETMWDLVGRADELIGQLALYAEPEAKATGRKD